MTEETKNKNESKYIVKEPPLLESKFVQFIEQYEKSREALENQIDSTAAAEKDIDADDEKEEGQEEKSFYHAWVYVFIGEVHFFLGKYRL